jgi:hypothetical protein
LVPLPTSDVDALGGKIEVRDSKARSGPMLSFTAAEFDAWLDGVRNGEFDHLVTD